MTDNSFLYKSIISSMNEGLLVINLKGIITHCNESASTLLNVDSKNLIGKKIALSFYKYKENDEFNQAILDAIYDRDKRHNTIVTYFTGTEYKQFNMTTFFLHENEVKIGVVIVLNDISELAELRDAVKAMERIKKLNKQLEMRNQLLNETFGRFLSGDIVKELLDTPGGLQLGGKKRDVTIMMSDLRGFTAICENLQPQPLIKMLNNYISVMAEIINKYKGTIIEFLGDGLLVVFGAPIETRLHAQNAVAAALEMQKAMPEINRWNKQNSFPELQMGIGLSSGETIVGNIGSFKNTKYGVIGKFVNLCGRIESYTTGGQILIAPATKALVEEPLEIANEFEILPKGLKAPITISDVTGIGGSLDIHIPKSAQTVKPCKKEIEITFSVIKDKIVQAESKKGFVLSASSSNAIIATEAHLASFDNIEIHTNPAIYAKVLHPHSNGYMIAFTTDSKALISQIEFYS